MPRLQKWPQNAKDWRNTILSTLVLSIFAGDLTAYLCAVYINASQGSWQNQGLWRFNFYDPLWSGAFEYAAIFSILTMLLLFFLSLVFFIIYRDKMAEWCLILLLIAIPFAIILPALAPAREKPVIYLYPATEQKVNVKLHYNGRIHCTYPEYPDEGWTVIAQPDGNLVDLRTGKHHYCLFWEGVDNFKYNTDEGFVVKGKDTTQFLESKLSILGLTDREKNEFIIYWLPRMQGNNYNLVSFISEQFAEQAKLEIHPSPDTIIRVFMVYKPLNTEIEIKPQELKSVTRRGFTVVEWGGSEL